MDCVDCYLCNLIQLADTFRSACGMLNHGRYGTFQFADAALFDFDDVAKLLDLIMHRFCLICLAGRALCQIFDRLVGIQDAFGYIFKFVTELFTALVQSFSGVDYAAQHTCQRLAYVLQRTRHFTDLVGTI